MAIKSTQEHMNVVGAVTIIVTEPVSVCIVLLLILLLFDFKLTLSGVKIPIKCKI